MVMVFEHDNALEDYMVTKYYIAFLKAEGVELI